MSKGGRFIDIPHILSIIVTDFSHFLSSSFYVIQMYTSAAIYRVVPHLHQTSARIFPSYLYCLLMDPLLSQALSIEGKIGSLVTIVSPLASIILTHILCVTLLPNE